MMSLSGSFSALLAWAQAILLLKCLTEPACLLVIKSFGKLANLPHQNMKMHSGVKCGGRNNLWLTS